MKPTKLTLAGIALVGALFGGTGTAHADELPGLGVQSSDYFYTGKPYDEDLGGYVFAFRDYDPEIGRWTSADPSGFPDGSNNFTYARNSSVNALDVLGLRVQWIAEEDSYSPNATWEALPATAFFWNVSHNGVTQLEGSFTGTFHDLYDNAATAGFVTWRNLGPGDFGDVYGLNLYSRTAVDSTWRANGWTVSAGFLENAGYTNAQRDAVNARINPWGAETSRNSLRGLSSYLYGFLVGQGADYSGELFYE